MDCNWVQTPPLAVYVYTWPWKECPSIIWSKTTSILLQSISQDVNKKCPLDKHCGVKGIAIKLRMLWGKYSQHAIKHWKPKHCCPTPKTHGQGRMSMQKTGCHHHSPLQPACHFKSEPQKMFASFNRWQGQSGHGQFDAQRYRLNRYVYPPPINSTMMHS